MAKVIRFSANWCQPCKGLAMILATEGLEVPVLDVDNSDTKPLMAQYGIRSVPTIVIDYGDGEFDSIVGSTLSQPHKDKIRQALAS